MKFLQNAYYNWLSLDRFLPYLCIFSLLLIEQANASVTLDFNTIDGNDVQHGTIITEQYKSSFGVTVSGENRSNGPDRIVAFDTFAVNTADPDLEDPFTVGNARFNTNFPDLVDPNINSNISRFQSALIIQENFNGPPDDEGSRPAGSIFFDFDNPITSLGFDLLDIEASGEFLNNDPNNSQSPAGTNTTSGYVGFFENGEEVARVGFNEFTNGGNFRTDNSDVVFGDHSANRFNPITVADLNDFANTDAENFDRIEFNFGGSGAVDNLTYTSYSAPPPANSVPEASSMLVWALLSLTVGCYKRWQ